MRLKQFAINLLPYGFAKTLLSRKEKKRIKNYVQKRQTNLLNNINNSTVDNLRLINFGCGKHYQQGWINIDFDNNGDLNLAFDRDTILPFEDNSIDGIFSEHFIEHIDFETGRKFIQESFRILKKGGIFRTITPNLETLKKLVREKLFRLKEMFISVGDFHTSPENLLDSEIVNWMFYGHGHQFIYDPETLTKICLEKGFAAVEQQKFGKTSRNVMAIERRKDEEFYSLYIEAVK